MEAAKRCLSQRIVLTRPNLTAYKDQHSPWSFSLTCLFSYMLPFSKNQSRGEKNLWEKQSKCALKAAPKAGMRSDGYRKEWSQACLPARSPRMPTLLCLPNGNQVCWRVGANSTRHHSFISDGNRFYNTTITCWFSPPSQAHPEERQDTGRVLSSHLQVPNSYLGINPTEGEMYIP